MKIGRLRRLGEIAQMILDTELAALKEAESARQNARRQADELRKVRDDTKRRAAPDPAHLAGADRRWEIWSSARLGELARQEALAAAEAEAQKNAAARAFGRSQALRTLLAREVQKARPRH